MYLVVIFVEAVLPNCFTIFFFFLPDVHIKSPQKLAKTKNVSLFYVIQLADVCCDSVSAFGNVHLQAFNSCILHNNIL